jgi:hypothetical protein
MSLASTSRRIEQLQLSPPTWQSQPGQRRSLIELPKPAAVATISENMVISMGPIMGGEDFAHYTQVVPGVFAFVGARNPNVGADKPHHHPRFTIDETARPIALRFLLSAVERTYSSGGGRPTDRKRNDPNVRSGIVTVTAAVTLGSRSST